MSEIGSDNLKAMLRAIAGRIADSRDQLNRLDAALGDGDHGASISAAFAKAVAEVADLPDPQPSEIWLTTAQSLMNGMGGASGALFGTLFLKGVAAIRGKERLVKADLNQLWAASLAGVKARGKAEIGDKTMVDALEPAVLAFAANDDAADAWQAAAEAARNGAESTRALIARQGRAKYLGERGIGHQDPGATTIALMFEALDSYWREMTNGKT
ncbi:MAG: dihydroxyacetone kinase subunit DhaL [Chloroflexi bacterium]|nr:dihydroxyacetone kinase subunit DhaL [Chloroflexota bacterium]